MFKGKNSRCWQEVWPILEQVVILESPLSLSLMQISFNINDDWLQDLRSNEVKSLASTIDCKKMDNLSPLPSTIEKWSQNIFSMAAAIMSKWRNLEPSLLCRDLFGARVLLCRDSFGARGLHCRDSFGARVCTVEICLEARVCTVEICLEPKSKQ